MVHLSGAEINQLFDVLSDWENILQAEKSLLNNDIKDIPLATTSEQEVS